MELVALQHFLKLIFKTHFFLFWGKLNQFKTIYSMIFYTEVLVPPPPPFRTTRDRYRLILCTVRGDGTGWYPLQVPVYLQGGGGVLLLHPPPAGQRRNCSSLQPIYLRGNCSITVVQARRGLDSFRIIKTTLKIQISIKIKRHRREELTFSDPLVYNIPLIPLICIIMLHFYCIYMYIQYMLLQGTPDNKKLYDLVTLFMRPY